MLITSNARVHNGEFVNTRCLTIDVTEQKIAQDALARRMEEQAALMRSPNDCSAPKRSTEVYDAALDAIMRALDCQRASILLFDNAEYRCGSWHGAGCPSTIAARSTAIRRGRERHDNPQPDLHRRRRAAPICRSI